MKSLLAIFALILSLSAFSQHDSTAVPEQKTVIGSVREKLNKLRGVDASDSLRLTAIPEDSLKLKETQALDSVNSKIDERLRNIEAIPNGLVLDTLKDAEWGEKIIQKADSIQRLPDASLSTIEQKLNQPKNKITQKADSLAALLEKPAQAVNEKVDSALNRVNARIDSLGSKAACWACIINLKSLRSHLSQESH